MEFRNFIKAFFLLSILFLMIIGIFNFFIDPFWTFGHSHKLNSLQEAPNEREQKSNLLYFQDNTYDTLMLGSSRVAFLNQNDFKDKKAFNYSFSLADPKNLAQYISFAKKMNGKDFKYIILGLDFFSTNKNTKENIKPEVVFDEITSFLYRYKILLSVDALKLSFENIKRSLLGRPGGRSYNRNNIAFTTKIPEDEVIKKVLDVEQNELNEFVNIKEYEYNESYKSILKNIKEQNPNSKFIVFTTATTLPHLNRIFENNLGKYYKRWLLESVEVFGKIIHFMDKNTITKNYSKYFMDFHHLYPKYSSYVTDKLRDIDSNTSPKDFGKVLTSENVQEYLKTID